MSPLRLFLKRIEFAFEAAVLPALASALLAGCGGSGESSEPPATVPTETATISSQDTPEGQELSQPEAATQREKPMAGGPGGATVTVFQDRLAVTSDPNAVQERVTSVSICGGSYVDSFQLTTNLRVLPRHGGAGGSCQVFTLAQDEQIVRVFGRAGSVIDQLGFTTSTGRQLGPVGSNGGKAFSMTIAGSVNGTFRGLTGTEGTFKGVRVVTQVNLIDDATGGNGGGAFIDRMLPDEKVLDITICWRTDAHVQSVQLRTNLGMRARHGTNIGVPCSTTTLAEGETIRELFGAADQYVHSLGFVTSTGRRVGPFGGPGGAAFSQTVLGGFAGLYGRSGGWLDKIGLMTLPTGAAGPYTFADQLPEGDSVRMIEVCDAKQPSGLHAVRSVRAFLASGGALPLNGGRADTNASTVCRQIHFAPGEFVTEMFGRSGSLVDAVGFRTNMGRDIGPFGGNGGAPFLLRNPSTTAFLGFAGRFQYNGPLAAIDFAAPDLFAPAVPPDATAPTAGWWGDMAQWPLVAVHASLLGDGRLLTYGTDASGTQGAQFIYDVWDPALGMGRESHLTLDNTTGTDLFCGAQTLLPDGKVLLAGGDNRQTPGGYNRGVRDTNLFNPITNALEPTLKLNRARWYATQTMLPSGRVLVTGGTDETDTLVPEAELYTPGQGWKTLTGTHNLAALGRMYPRVFVPPRGASSGDVVYVVATGTAKVWRLDVDANGGQGVIVDTGVRLPEQHSWSRPATMIAPDKALLQLNSGATTILQLPSSSSSLPTVMAAGSMSQPRLWSNFVVLPTGDVLAVGGSSVTNRIDTGSVAKHAEIWNASTRTWRTLASELRPRLYHSNATLLADGRVLSSGGGAPGPVLNLNAQVFTPPYLYAPGGGGAPATRANLISAPATLAYDGTNFNVTSTRASTITKATLVRLGSSTHSFDFDQRLVNLTIVQRTSTGLTLRGPNNRFTAPPGKYLLTLVDSNGVPSNSRVVTMN